MWLVDVVRRSVALKVAMLVGSVMLVIVLGMSVYVTKQTSDDHLKSMEEFLYTKAKIATQIGAHTYGSILDEAIDSNLLMPQEVFDKEYKLIDGYNWSGRPKYHTKYDSYTDKSVIEVEDAFLLDQDFVFAIGVDTDGYCPTHNSKYQNKMTGDPAKDAVGNRTKRIFDDPVGINAAKNTTDGLKQIYKRDTGEVMWDVSSPIFVKGQHWGGFRIAVSMEKLQGRAAAFVQFLLLAFGALILLSIITLVVMLKRSLAPVEVLSSRADQISSGEDLKTPITSKRVDEIGRLTKSIERLRVSMKAAMERLGADD